MTPAQRHASDADECRSEPDRRHLAIDDGPWAFDPETGEDHPSPICYREPCYTPPGVPVPPAPRLR